jgi:hypothetical protein
LDPFDYAKESLAPRGDERCTVRWVVRVQGKLSISNRAYNIISGRRKAVERALSITGKYNDLTPRTRLTPPLQLGVGKTNGFVRRRMAGQELFECGDKIDLCMKNLESLAIFFQLFLLCPCISLIFLPFTHDSPTFKHCWGVS